MTNIVWTKRGRMLSFLDLSITDEPDEQYSHCSVLWQGCTHCSLPAQYVACRSNTKMEGHPGKIGSR